MKQKGQHSDVQFGGLAEQRRRCGISLESVAEATKISLHFLRAIEQENFQDLPGGVFNTSYIRQYARCTGADESEILQRYSAFLSAADPAPVTPTFGMSRLELAIRELYAKLRSYLLNTPADRERSALDA